MSLLDDILNHKIETKDTPKKDTLKQILNNEIPQTSQPMGQYQASIFASRVSPVDNYTSQRNFAAEKLQESRKKYQDYLNEQTKDTRSQKITPLTSITDLDLTAKKSAMEELVSKNAQAFEKAKNTQEAKQLKADLKQKQNTFNYANYLKNVQDVNEADYNILQKIVNPIVSGAADLFQIDKLDPESQYYYDSEGNKSYLPTKRSLKQQKIRETSSSVGRVYNDVVYNLSKAVTSKVLDMFTGMGGSILYYGDIMLDSTEEAKKQGFNNTEALAYGAGVTGLAKVLDTIIGTFGGLSNVSDKVPTMSQGLDKFFFKITSNKTASTILSNMGSEAISEFAEEYADNALKYIINSDQSGYDSFINMLGETWPDALYSGLVGGISGGIGGTVENITNDTEIQERKQALEDYKTTLENIKPQTIEEANYKNDEINKVDEAIEQIEKREEEIKQPTKVEEYKEQLKKVEEQKEKIKSTTKEETKPVEETKPKQEVKEPTYKNAGNIEYVPEEGYTAYYEVNPTETRDLYGYKNSDSKDIDYDKLNNAGFDLITYNPNGTENIYEFNSKKDLNKYIKSIGGYSAMEGKYTIMSNIKDGEFYYVRDKYAKGGWKWEDVNGDNIRGWMDNERQLRYEIKDEEWEDYIKSGKTRQEYVKERNQKQKELSKNQIKQDYSQLAKENNYDKKQTNITEKIADDVISISTNETELKDLSTIMSPPGKTQKTTKVKTVDGNVTTHYNPSKNIVDKGESEVYKFVQNKVSDSEKKKIEVQDRKVMSFIEKDIEQARKNGDNKFADMLENDIIDYTYTVEHMGENKSKAYKNFLERYKSGETDLEMEYASIINEYNELVESGKWNEIDPQTNNKQYMLDWQYKATTLLKVLRKDKSGTYTEARKMIYDIIKSDIRHSAGQNLALASIEEREDPSNIPDYTMNLMYSMYEQEKKYHRYDQKWIDENNPYDLTNNSPYRLTNEEFDNVERLTDELMEIDQKTNNEAFQKKLNEVNNYVAELKVMRLKGLTGLMTNFKNGLVNLVKQNNLLSMHVGLYNMASNVADTIGLNIIERTGTNIAEQRLSKKTGFKTNQYTKDGRSIHFKGIVEGIKTVGKQFKDGIKYSDLNTKYNMDEQIDYTKIGQLDRKLRAKTKLGKILVSPLNFEGRVVNAWMSLGDTPKATAVRNESLYNQLRLEAMKKSINTGKDSIFYTLTDEKSGNITYYYTDSDGDVSRKTFTSKEAASFLEGRNQIEATDNMIEIAHKDGEDSVYTGKNIFNEQAQKVRSALNSILPGLGDLTVQFCTVTNNIAVQIYRHNVISLPELKIKTNKLQNNLALIDSKIDEYKSKNKDYTMTKDYENKMNENYKLQHDLAINYSKVLSGTALTASMIILKALNIATGDVDKDEEDKGVQDYSIKIGDKYISYDFGLFGAIAKSGLAVSDAFTGEKGLLKSSIGAFKGYGETIFQQTFLKDLIGTFTSEYGESFEDRFADFWIGIASSATTPGIVKEITLAFDDYTSRSTYSNDKWQYLINRLNANWNREALPKKFDGWGNTIRKGSTLIDSAWNTFFKDKFISTTKQNKLDTELAELYQMTGSTDILPLKSNDVYRNNVSSFSYKNTKYKLTDQEKAKFSETYGKFAYENLNKLIQSDVYKKADNDTKVNYIKQIYQNALDEAKKEYLKTQGIEYNNTGQKVVIVGSNDRYEQATILDAIDNNISYDSAIKKQSNPETYNYAKTITGDYDIYSHADEMYNQIKDEYNNTNDRKIAFINYVNSCSNLSAVQKAMLIKTKYKSSYKSYNEQIKAYLKKKNLSNEEYQYALNKMGIK